MSRAFDVRTPLRSLGAEIPRSTLVELTIEHAPARGRIARTFETSADGLRAPVGLYDTALDEACYARTLSDDTAVCVPIADAGALSTARFADASCRMPVVSRDACSTARHVARYAEAVCPNDVPRIYEFGAEVASDEVFLDNGESCEPVARLDMPYFNLGVEVAPARLTRYLEGSGAARRVVVSDGENAFDGEIFDAAHDTECYFQQFLGGEFRCVAAEAFVTDAFTDRNCTRPIQLVEYPRGAASCEARRPPKLAYSFLPGVDCDPLSIAIHAVGERYTEPVYRKQGACTADSSSSSDWYRVGAERRLDELPTAKVVVDP